jgi:hypothetical protein
MTLGNVIQLHILYLTEENRIEKTPVMLLTFSILEEVVEWLLNENSDIIHHAAQGENVRCVTICLNSVDEIDPKDDNRWDCSVSRF